MHNSPANNNFPGALLVYDNESWKLGDRVHIIIILYFQISLIAMKTQMGTYNKICLIE